jgi:dihydropyrimidine dehydrogenase (NAD+) subunit PreT
MGSALTILDANVLGASCSRVCPVEVLCEGACVMLRYNKQPIAIGRLQRHAMDHFLERGGRCPRNRAKAQPKDRVHRRGSGVAGLRG